MMPVLFPAKVALALPARMGFLPLPGLAGSWSCWMSGWVMIVDLILAGNKRPGMMFVCFLLGGIGLGLAFGLLDLFVLNIGSVETQNHVSGGVDLVLGITLLAVGALLATDHVRIRRRGHRPPPKDKQPSKLSVWAQRSLHEPRYGLAVLIGAAPPSTWWNTTSRPAPATSWRGTS
jgi:hypothetical protein